MGSEMCIRDRIKQRVLISSLTKKSLKLFYDYLDAESKRNSAVAEQAYKSGFCTATQLIFSGLMEPERLEADQ